MNLGLYTSHSATVYLDSVGTFLPTGTTSLMFCVGGEIDFGIDWSIKQMIDR
jgi:hypothetical protein